MSVLSHKLCCLHYGKAVKQTVGLQVLRGMPALQGLPDRTFEFILTHGRLVRYAPGQVILQPPEAAVKPQPDAIAGVPCTPSGIFIVAVGLVRWSFTAAAQAPKVSSCACQELYEQACTACFAIALLCFNVLT